MPKTGYRTDNKTRYLDPAGFKRILITNAKDLEILLTNNRTFAGELAHNLSARTRVTLIRRASELNVRLTNGKGKVRTEEKKKEAQ
jgi:large subunit ribosomal protein L32e